MSAFPGFPPASRKFLQQLRRHNNREWFEKNRHVYEASLKEPVRELVAALGTEFARFAPEIVADPAKSIYRIYRDVRFSKDKSPYKTHVAAIFPVRGLTKNSGPGLYFHYSAEEVLIAGGVYMPQPAELRAIREHIAVEHKRLKKIVTEKKFRALFSGLQGEQSKRLPKGWLPGHPAEQFLHYKQFLFARQYDPELATSRKLFTELLAGFRAGLPLIRFLSEPLLAATTASNFASDKPRLAR